MFSRKTIISFTASIFCLSTLVLANTGKLTLYVHPRYSLFTIIMSILALILLLPQITSAYENDEVTMATYFALGVAVISLVLPAQSLSPKIATYRSASIGGSTTSQNLTVFDSFSQDASRFTLQDWVAVFSSSPNQTQIEGQRVKISGFIFENESQQRFLGRFKLTCCAVDATPLGIALADSDLVRERWIGSWYEVEGTFVYSESKQQFELQVSTLRGIAEPEQPYVY